MHHPAHAAAGGAASGNKTDNRRISAYNLLMDTQPSAEEGRALLLKAAAKLGGMSALALRLGVKARALEPFLEGRQRVTEGLYLAAVGIVLEAPGGPAAVS